MKFELSGLEATPVLMNTLVTDDLNKSTAHVRIEEHKTHAVIQHSRLSSRLPDLAVIAAVPEEYASEENKRSERTDTGNFTTSTAHFY